jgi:signal transduction histidine kinase
MPVKRRILYIEDDPASQRLIQRVLEQSDYAVFVADEGLAGINLARETEPDLILMDMNLPGMNGREITTRLRSLSPFAEVPIIALTANTGSGHREQALAAGCDGYLTKPIDVATFRQELATFLQGRREELAAADRLHHLEHHARTIVARLEDKIRELEAANERLREIDRLKSDFIGLISHELRTPLTLVEGYAHLLAGTVGRAPDEVGANSLRPLVDGLNVGVDRISRLIADIINASRIASGELELGIRSLQLAELVAFLVDDIAGVLAQRNLRLEVSGFDQVPAIEGDPGHLYTALTNIVGNAIKYTPDGGVITLSAAMVGEAVNISIADTGIGIPPREQTRIFDQFYVLDPIENHTTSKSAFKGGGIGLGLTIARGIIEAHQGRIWVSSRGGDGSVEPGATFHILLPLCQPLTRASGAC